MNDPTFLRVMSKQQAKQRIAEVFWPTMAAGALYVIPLTVLTLLSLLLPMQLQEEYPLWMDGALTIAELLVTAPLSYGFGLYCVAHSRGVPTSAFTVFEPLGSLRLLGRALGVSLSMMVRVLPLFVLRVALIYGVPGDSSLAGLANFLLILIMLAESCLQLAMSAAFNLIYDDETIGCWRAVGEGLALYRGRLISLFVFILSFLPWGILGSLSCGVVLPFVTAYQNVAFARMTDMLRFPEPPSEPPVE